MFRFVFLSTVLSLVCIQSNAFPADAPGAPYQVRAKQIIEMIKGGRANVVAFQIIGEQEAAELANGFQDLGYVIDNAPDGKRTEIVAALEASNTWWHHSDQSGVFLHFVAPGIELIGQDHVAALEIEFSTARCDAQEESDTLVIAPTLPTIFLPGQGYVARIDAAYPADDLDGEGCLKITNFVLAKERPRDVTREDSQTSLVGSEFLAGKAVASGPSSNYGTPRFPVELSHDDELFVINGEKFEARTYCFNVEEGDEVMFIDGDANGVCVSAAFISLRTGKTCEVWCD
ncbi:MAG: hypothetical protein ACOZAA_02665 [Pseudomonadota bacterium]